MRTLAANDFDQPLVDLFKTQHVSMHPFAPLRTPSGPLAIPLAVATSLAEWLMASIVSTPEVLAGKTPTLMYLGCGGENAMALASELDSRPRSARRSSVSGPHGTPGPRSVGDRQLSRVASGPRSSRREGHRAGQSRCTDPTQSGWRSRHGGPRQPSVTAARHLHRESQDRCNLS